jgi:NAD-dependent DNA ligase
MNGKNTLITVENKDFWELETPATVFSLNKEANLVGLLCIAIKSVGTHVTWHKSGQVGHVGNLTNRVVKDSIIIPEGTVLFITEQNIAEKRIKVSYEQSTHWISTGGVVLVHVENILKQAKFAFTGELTLNRECYKQIIAIKGGKTSSTVTKECKYLVIGHRNSSAGPTTKLKMAKKLGLKILDEKELNNMLLGKQ